MIDWYQPPDQIIEAIHAIANDLPEEAWNTETFQEFSRGTEGHADLGKHLETAWAEYLAVPVVENEVDRRTYVTHLIMKEARDSWRAALGGRLDQDESLDQAEWASRLLATLASI